MYTPRNETQRIAVTAMDCASPCANPLHSLGEFTARHFVEWWIRDGAVTVSPDLAVAMLWTRARDSRYWQDKSWNALRDYTRQEFSRKLGTIDPMTINRPDY